jgi:DNA-binding LacI/PurR family transcriptional regulator
MEYHVVAPVDVGRAGVAAAVEQALGLGGERPGFVVPNSSVIQHVLQELHERGVVAGRDLSVVGLCPDVVADAMIPPVSNVSLEPRDVSRRAMQILFNLLDREGAPPPGQVQLVVPRLTARQTTVPHP